MMMRRMRIKSICRRTIEVNGAMLEAIFIVTATTSDSEQIELKNCF